MNSGKLQRFLEEAAAGPVTLTVRDLLAMWEVKVRNFDTVPRIAADLANAGLKCEPAFADVGLDGSVRVSPQAATEAGGQIVDASDLVFPHAAPLIESIPSARREVRSIPPNATLAQAYAEMMAHGYSQLAVMAETGKLIGTVSWERIGHIRVGSPNAELADVIDPDPYLVKLTDDLLSKIETVYKAGFVLVTDHEGDVCGIVTTADLTEQFHLLAEPFFLVGEIEKRLRRCIDKAFEVEDLQRVNKKIESVNGMTFGEYVRFLKVEGIWPRLSWQIDCALFVKHLDEVREVRNEIMHFRPDPLTPKQRERLRLFASWMRNLAP